jgi:hypothetical protein
MKPEFVDNREITLAEALKAHLDWLHETYRQPVEMAIATGYFNPEGFALVADRLERLARVRLLLGAEPIPPPAQPLRMPGDPPPDRYETKLVTEALERHAKGMERDRNLLEFSPETDRAIRRLLEFLASGKIVGKAGFGHPAPAYKYRLVIESVSDVVARKLPHPRGATPADFKVALGDAAEWPQGGVGN